jgi:KDO2-lipid IV(A) lauroyltransferase
MYILSDITRFFAYYVVKYRRIVVATNLRNSFPEKSAEELKRIEKAYYKHFCDMFLEINYLLHAKEKRLIKMCKFNNIDLLNKYYSEGKSVIVAAGHYSNWEFLSIIASQMNHILLGVYKPVANKRFEVFINKSRARFGAVPVPMHDAFKTVLDYNKNRKLFFLCLIADQTPARSKINYWTSFLNQDTPVFLGIEKIAIKTNQPVLFCNMQKVERGKYEVEFIPLCENPKETKPFEITELHVRALERIIRKNPEYWLWSHRRWKFKRAGDKIIKQTIG